MLTGAPNLFPTRAWARWPSRSRWPMPEKARASTTGTSPGRCSPPSSAPRSAASNSYSMICSEKELGISDEHEGVIILDDDAPVGMPLVDYMGDAVLEIAITAQHRPRRQHAGRGARDGRPDRQAAAPAATTSCQAEGPSDRRARPAIEITQPRAQPALRARPDRRMSRSSPAPTGCSAACAWRACARSTTSSMPPTTSCSRSASRCTPLITTCWCSGPAAKPPTIITRTAQPGERLTTLDGVERTLDDFTVLVCDTAGALSIAGVMGGAEWKSATDTRNILLEGAAWNFINIRRTVAAQKLALRSGLPLLARRAPGHGRARRAGAAWS